ncbi:hypothetical protein Leryth_017859 [Lithospermum erythrorhizon]|nr:hypothetical protein Leryth_017859 [Lithospermum erythrorhizon]
MEPSLWIIWRLLPQSHSIYNTHLRCHTMLCMSFINLFL